MMGWILRGLLREMLWMVTPMNPWSALPSMALVRRHLHSVKKRATSVGIRFRQTGFAPKKRENHGANPVSR